MSGSATHAAHHDPGLAVERTALAWRRTLLALAAAILVTLRTAALLDAGTALALAAIGALLLLGPMGIRDRRRSRRTDAAHRDACPLPRGVTVVGASAATTLTGTAAFVLVHL